MISYAFPPVGGAGVQRAAKLVKFLHEFGISPSVLTVSNPSVPLRDEALMGDIPPGTRIVRAATLEPSYGAKQATWKSEAVEHVGLFQRGRRLAMNAARKALVPLRLQTEDGALLSRVSQVLRHYVAAAFDLPTGELTTAEFCGAITGHPLIGPELSAALSAFLHLCDQDKFSPPAPVPPLSAVAQALKLIDQAQARLTALAQPAVPPKTGAAK